MKVKRLFFSNNEGKALFLLIAISQGIFFCYNCPSLSTWSISLESFHDPAIPTEPSNEETPEPFRPLVFGAGFGTTATHAVFHATCQLNLSSLHYHRQCGFAGSSRKEWLQTSLPEPGLLAQMRLQRSYRSLVTCILKSNLGGNETCPSVKQTFNTMRRHIDAVISSRDVDAIHDVPYPEFAYYVIDATERIRGTKPIIVLSTRNPDDWATKRSTNHQIDVVCKLNMRDSSGIIRPIGQNMYWCIQTALQKGLGDNSIVDILSHIQHFSSTTEETMALALSSSVQFYQEKMENMSRYNVNLFERNPRIDPPQIAMEINAETKMVPDMASVTPLPVRTLLPSFGMFNERLCMPGWTPAFISGRHCSKLVMFLNFRDSGGTYITEYLRSFGLFHNPRINAYPQKYGELNLGNGINVSTRTRSNLRIGSSTGKSRVSDSSFWGSLYNRGLDIVSLEENFVTAEDYPSLSHTYKITQIRNPWERFVGTYVRELQLKCNDEASKETCLDKYSLKKWTSPYKDEIALEEKGWEEIFYPNYYVRMLNGMADSDALLTRDHLEAAKARLSSFDVVLIREDDDKINLEKLWKLFGSFKYVDPEKALTLNSNNLKCNGSREQPICKQIRGDSDLKTSFEDHNILDIELYQFARELGNVVKAERQSV
mmetsp:Transcript_37629/g.64180  ORF Transcript_37629/g.64180 Transcript_37629/m.64180 type:complete len:656 (+) Transcript_37629:60-2027(+)